MKLGTSRVIFGNEQSIGLREQQEDYFAIVFDNPVPQNAHRVMAVLADGMGGSASGEIASVVAVDTVIEVMQQQNFGGDNPARALLQAAHHANDAVYELAAGSEMGTTLVAVIFDGNSKKVDWLSVGDSVILRFREGRIERLNADHNLGNEMDAEVAAGRMTPEQAARRVDERAHLTSFIGDESIAQVEQSNQSFYQEDEVYILASDGLTDTLSLQEIGSVVAASPPEELAACLVQAALTKENPIQDNVSVVTVAFYPAKKPRIIRGKILLYVLLAAGLIGSALWFAQTKMGATIDKIRLLLPTPAQTLPATSEPPFAPGATDAVTSPTGVSEATALHPSDVSNQSASPADISDNTIAGKVTGHTK